VAAKKTKKHEIRNTAIDRKWFRERMDALGLTREQVAKAFDAAPYMVTRMIVGERPVRLDEIKTWADVLEVHTVEIVRRLGVPVPPPTVPVIGVLRSNARVSLFAPNVAEKIESPRLEPGAPRRSKAINSKAPRQSYG